jgi:hypothetical protein
MQSKDFIGLIRIMPKPYAGLISSTSAKAETPSANFRSAKIPIIAAFLFAPDSGIAAIYPKQKLVMFGEYIPFARWIPFLKWFTPITGGYGVLLAAVLIFLQSPRRLVRRNLCYCGDTHNCPKNVSTKKFVINQIVRSVSSIKEARVVCGIAGVDPFKQLYIMRCHMAIRKNRVDGYKRTVINMTGGFLYSND